MAIEVVVNDTGSGPPGPVGPPGPKGDPGSAVIKWFEGDGPPPEFIPGAEVGSLYTDKLSGAVYQLQPGG